MNCQYFMKYRIRALFKSDGRSLEIIVLENYTTLFITIVGQGVTPYSQIQCGEGTILSKASISMRTISRKVNATQFAFYLIVFLKNSKSINHINSRNFGSISFDSIRVLPRLPSITLTLPWIRTHIRNCAGREGTSY